MRGIKTDRRLGAVKGVKNIEVYMLHVLLFICEIVHFCPIK